MKKANNKSIIVSLISNSTNSPVWESQGVANKAICPHCGEVIVTVDSIHSFLFPLATDQWVREKVEAHKCLNEELSFLEIEFVLDHALEMGQWTGLHDLFFREYLEEEGLHVYKMSLFQKWREGSGSPLKTLYMRLIRRISRVERLSIKEEDELEA